MEHLEQWSVSAVLAAVFVAANCVNIALFRQMWRSDEEDARRYPIVLIGGIGGAMSFAVSPSATLRKRRCGMICAWMSLRAFE